jgi:hypothetical protein
MLVKKDGYVPFYVDYRKEAFNRGQDTLRMKTSRAPFVPLFSQHAVGVMYWFNLIVISLLNLFTLGFVLFKRKLRVRFLWAAAILVLNTTLYVLYLDGSLVHFHLLNGPVYLTPYWMYPYSLKIVLPLASLAFWILYLFKRDSITKK